MRHLLLSSLFIAAPLAASAQMISVSITNSNFETGGLVDGGFSNGASVAIPTGWSAIPGNAPSGGNYGYFNPQDGAYTSTSGSPGTIGTMDGPNVFYFGTCITGQGIQQATSTSFALNTSYTLTVSVGCRSTPAVMANLTMQIYAGTTQLATATVRNQVANTFTDYVLTYTGDGVTNAGAVGGALTVRLAEDDQGVSGGEVDVDNVRLVSNAVPEPATCAEIIMGAGAATLACCRRRSRPDFVG